MPRTAPVGLPWAMAVPTMATTRTAQAHKLRVRCDMARPIRITIVQINWAWRSAGDGAPQGAVIGAVPARFEDIRGHW